MAAYNHAAPPRAKALGLFRNPGSRAIAMFSFFQLLSDAAVLSGKRTIA